MADFILNDWHQILDPAPWAVRCLHRAVSALGYIYICGGASSQLGGATKYNDVWRSADGITWELVTAAAGWSPRSAHGFMYYNNLFFVFGGANAAGTFLRDVWSSPDCITWTQVSAAAPWTARHEFACCEVDGKIMLSGGYGSFWAGYLSDVWETTDGSTWNLKCAAIDAATMGPREHVMDVFNGSVWIYGGVWRGPGNHATRLIYRSNDNGATWTNLGNAAWGKRKEHQVVKDSDNTRIAIIGGNDDVIPLNDVWETTDGINFTSIVQINPFVARSDFALVNHWYTTYIIGGADNIGNGLQDVWSGYTELFADFTGNPIVIHLGETVRFINTSVGDVLFCMWNFGYASPFGLTYAMTSGMDGIDHKFMRVGIFTITLQVLFEDLSILRETKIGYITVLPYELDFTGTPRNGRVPLRTRFTAELVE